MLKMAQATALLVEDDEVFAEELQEFLNAHGIDTVCLDTLDGLLDEVLRRRPDLLVLDQFVAGRDCLTCLPDLRTNFSGGIIVLTGNQDATDRVVALETGADDFVLKPAGSRELLARLRALLRRLQLYQAPEDLAANAVLATGPWLMDARHQEFRAPNGTRVPLTPAEFDTLRFLAARIGKLVTRDELSHEILKRPFTPFDRSVDNIISRLRRAIEPYLLGEPIIRPIRGQGYVFMGPEFVQSPPVPDGAPSGGGGPVD